jgi:hypothetical protein
VQTHIFKKIKKSILPSKVENHSNGGNRCRKGEGASG